MSLVLTAALLAAQGWKTAPKPGALGKNIKYIGLEPGRPRVALLPLWVLAPVPSEVASASAKAFVDAAPTLQKSTQSWAFVDTKTFHKKIEPYAAIPGGPWTSPEVDKIALGMKADYVARLTILSVGYFGNAKTMGTVAVASFQLRDLKHSKYLASYDFLGAASVTIGEPKAIPTVRDAVYDLVVNRLAAPQNEGSLNDDSDHVKLADPKG